MSKTNDAVSRILRFYNVGAKKRGPRSHVSATPPTLSLDKDGRWDIVLRINLPGGKFIIVDDGCKIKNGADTDMVWKKCKAIFNKRQSSSTGYKRCLAIPEMVGVLNYYSTWRERK